MTARKLWVIFSTSVFTAMSITIVVLSLVIRNRNSKIDVLNLEAEKRQLQISVDKEFYYQELNLMEDRRLKRDSLTKINSKHKHDENIALLDTANSRTIRELTLRLISR